MVHRVALGAALYARAARAPAEHAARVAPERGARHVQHRGHRRGAAELDLRQPQRARRVRPLALGRGLQRAAHASAQRARREQRLAARGAPRRAAERAQPLGQGGGGVFGELNAVAVGVHAHVAELAGEGGLGLAAFFF